MIATLKQRPSVQRGWRLAGPLTAWREDLPELLPQCSVNGETIAVGAHYAIGPGNRIACLPCAQVSGPAPVEQPRPLAPPSTEQTRICAGEGCYERFATTNENRGQRYHAPSCRPKAVQQRQAAAARPSRAPAWREERTCPGCRETFTATSSNREQRYCGQSCSGRANVRQTPAPAPVAVEVEGLTRARHGPACPCLACAERRAELGLAPLDIVIGDWRLPALPVWKRRRMPFAED